MAAERKYDEDLDRPWRDVLDVTSVNAERIFVAAGCATVRDLCEAVLSQRLLGVAGCSSMTFDGIQRILLPWLVRAALPPPAVEPTPEWYDEPWSGHLPDLSVRAAYALLQAQIDTVGQAWNLVRNAHLLRIRLFGRKTLNELQGALAKLDAGGPDEAQWGPGGRPTTVAALVEQALGWMSRRGRGVILSVIVDGRPRAEVAKELEVSTTRLGQVIRKDIGRAARRLQVVAKELVAPVIEELELMGGAGRGSDIEQVSGGEPPGRVLLALRVAGETRYRLFDGNLTRHEAEETRARLPEAKPLLSRRTSRTRGMIPGTNEEAR